VARLTASVGSRQIILDSQPEVRLFALRARAYAESADVNRPALKKGNHHHRHQDDQDAKQDKSGTPAEQFLQQLCVHTFFDFRIGLQGVIAIELRR
jgi:hypothetical protein